MKMIRGQSMTIQCDKALPALYSGDFGLSRLSPNEYLVGSTYALDDEGIDVRESDVQTLTQRLLSHFSTAEVTPTAHHTGVRVAFPDRMPGFGESLTHQRMLQEDHRLHRPLEGGLRVQSAISESEREGTSGVRFFAATGFGSHGGTHASLAGESIAEMIAGAPRALPRSMRDKFRPDRFDPSRG
jgi:glycine/D-amino acid oxidase-like deaminating enzyme